MSDNAMKKIRLAGKIGAVIGLIVLIRYFNLPAYADPVMGWIRGMGYWSPVIFTFLFVSTAGILLPMPLLMMSAGAIYGVAAGTAIVVAATVVEGLWLYLIAVRFERRLRGSRVLQNKYFVPVQRMLQDGGWRMIGLLRCLPYMSFVFLSFVCSLSRIRLRPYLIGTAVGMTPVSLAYVYAGAVTRASLGQEAAAAQTSVERIIMYAGLALAVGISVFITVKANRYMKKYQPGLVQA